jgi:hypothetical protein
MSVDPVWIKETAAVYAPHPPVVEDLSVEGTINRLRTLRCWRIAPSATLCLWLSRGTPGASTTFRASLNVLRQLQLGNFYIAIWAIYYAF